MAKKNEVNLVVKSAVKDYISQGGDEGMRTAGDLADALNEKIQGMLDAAIQRAEANGRKTVQAADL